GLLWVGSWDSIVLAIVPALIGVTFLASAIEGWLMGPLNAALRIALAVSAVALVAPTGWVKLGAFSVICAVSLLRYLALRKSGALLPRSGG
ncbi:MAG: hypothetical protein AAEJ43_04980, partial [Gammaproteobacteria bacterium]